MSDTVKEVKIQISGIVDNHESKALISKIKAAMHNGVQQLVLDFSNADDIQSAEFLGFLGVAGKHMDEQSSTLTLTAFNAKVKSLFELFHLNKYAEPEEVGKND